ncbi:MAG: MFS transporter [Marinisporobacter sp.]|nr:MFS transporter [Marinisporobacter sp.]
MNEKKIRKTFFYTSILLVLIIFVLTGFTNIDTFQKRYTDSFIATYVVQGTKFVNKVEYAIQYGKEIDNFYGMESLLSNWLEQTGDIDVVKIISKENNIQYEAFKKNTNSLNTYSTLPDSLKSYTAFEKNELFNYTLYKNYYHIFIPIKDKNNLSVATFEMIFSKGFVNHQMSSYIKSIFFYFVCMIFFTLFILYFYSFRGKLFDTAQNFNRKKVIITLLLIMGTVQIIYGSINYFMFYKAYYQISIDNAFKASKTLKADIEAVIDKDISYENLQDLEVYLNKIDAIVPQIDSIQLSNGLYSSTPKTTPLHENIDTKYTIAIPLKEDIKGQTPELKIFISEKFIQSGLTEILLDTITIFATFFFFMVEIVLFFTFYMIHKTTKKPSQGGKEPRENTSNLRFLAFIVYTASFLSISFIPKVMKGLYEPIPGLSNNFVLGLPVSIVFFTGAIFTFFGGKWIDRIGWKKIQYIGLACLLISALFSGLAWNAMIFILARGIYGIGYALTYISMRSCAASQKDEVEKKKSFSSITSGIYAGVNTGAVFGAILMDKIGYQKVFYISTLLMMIAFFISKYFFLNEKVVEKSSIIHKTSKLHLLDFVKNFEVLSFFLLISMPMAISVLFLDFFLPIYASERGIQTATIGRAYLLNGICIAYMGPILTKHFSKKLDNKKTIILSIFFLFVGYLTFAYYGTLIAILIAAALMGLGEGFGLPSQTEYYLNLPATKKIGRGEALGYYTNIKKIAQMMGPQIFALSINKGYQRGIGYIAIVILGMIVLFVFTNKFNKNTVEKVSPS